MKVIPKKNNSGSEQRFVIADDDGNIVNDAQGYGYKSKQKAYKVIWYKFQGGKKKIQQKEEKKRTFFKKYPGLEEFLNNIYEYEYKAIARGEITIEDIRNAVREEFDTDIPKDYINI